MSEEQAIPVAPPRTVHRGSPQGHPAFHRGGRPARHHGHDREICLGAAVDAPIVWGVSNLLQPGNDLFRWAALLPLVMAVGTAFYRVLTPIVGASKTRPSRFIFSA